MDNEYLLKASVDELTQGFLFDENKNGYICLVCNQLFEDGVIYPFENKLYEAKKAIEIHIQAEHTSMFHYLIDLDKRFTGLTETQKELLQYLHMGLTDREIVQKQKGGSPSTIRNHRFKLREKEKQAKIFLAIMNSLKMHLDKNEDELISIHKGATMVDDRYVITKDEEKKVLETYFKNGLDGPLSTFPSKEKRKIIVLRHLLKRFKKNEIYTEKEINETIKPVYDDFVTIRRYFIEYGFMERSKDGSQYWLKD